MTGATCFFASLAESHLPPDIVAGRHVLLAALFKAVEDGFRCEFTVGRLLSTRLELRGARAGRALLLIRRRRIANTQSQKLMVVSTLLERRCDQDPVFAARVAVVSRNNTRCNVGSRLEAHWAMLKHGAKLSSDTPTMQTSLVEIDLNSRGKPASAEEMTEDRSSQ